MRTMLTDPGAVPRWGRKIASCWLKDPRPFVGQAQNTCLKQNKCITGATLPKKTYRGWGSRRVKWYSSVQSVAVLSLTEHTTAQFVRGEISTLWRCLPIIFSCCSDVSRRWTTIVLGLTTVWEKEIRSFLSSLHSTSAWWATTGEVTVTTIMALSSENINEWMLFSLFLGINHFINCIHGDWKTCPAYSPPATVVFILFLLFEVRVIAASV